MEIARLHQMGLVSCLDDYLTLPLPILQDARELWEADDKRSELLSRRAEIEARYRQRR